MLKIRDAEQGDYLEISILLTHVFGQRNEERLIAALRASNETAAELVAEDDSGLVGHICLSWLAAPQGWMTLAPVAVRTQNQNHGIGSDLVRYALDQARQRKASAVVVVGDPEYYKRFGFVFDGPAILNSPYPVQYTGLYPIDPETASTNVTLAYPDAFESA